MTPRSTNCSSQIVDDSNSNVSVGMIVDGPMKMKNKERSRPLHRPPRDSPTKSAVAAGDSIHTVNSDVGESRRRSSSLRRMIRPSGSWSAGGSQSNKSEKQKFPVIGRSNSLTRLLSKGGSKNSNKQKLGRNSPPPINHTPVLKKSGKYPASSTIHTKESPQEADEIQMEDDPVMALFETRNTNRVRFSVDNDEPRKEKGGPRSASPPPGAGNTSFNIKSFMKKNLFGQKKSGNSDIDAEVLEIEKSVSSPNKQRIPFVWTSAETAESSNPDVLHAPASKQGVTNLNAIFTENPKTRSDVAKLLSRGERAQNRHFQYAYAVKCFVRAAEKLKKAKYPDDHPTVQQALEELNNAHHALTSFNNSANIVKMGIRHEDSGELIKALKLFTIAYRIRRDNLSRAHPSLVVLLNMLASVQIKRGEYTEAMSIYELALMDSPLQSSSNNGADGRGTAGNSTPPSGKSTRPTVNLMARSVTYRDMGTIYEKWGDETKALEMYHSSLGCVSEWRDYKKKLASKINCKESGEDAKGISKESDSSAVKSSNGAKPMWQFTNLQVSKSLRDDDGDTPDGACEGGEMEVFIPSPAGTSALAGGGTPITSSFYHSFFEEHNDKNNDGETKISEEQKANNDPTTDLDKSKAKDSIAASKSVEKDTFADVDIALTLHQIAQLYRRQRHYSMALDAYNAALRGMKLTLGTHHSNVSAILGNIGNLYKEMGDLDSAFSTYQEVLGLESYRLGLSHPEVAITLHNIATIEALRGHYENALKLYKRVLSLQKKLFGKGHISVAATTACMGDVYERRGNLEKAMELGESALQIKMKELGRHNTEVGRTLHKLGKIAFQQNLYNLAESYLNRALLIYRLNNLGDGHEWIVEATRDSADIDAVVALGTDTGYEC